MIKIRCPAQNYAWGRREDCEVAELVRASGEEVDAGKPYAELWMGTHPSGPAVLAREPGLTLREWLQQSPAALGPAASRFDGELPFLFKVLSVETALSIQSHPDKALAERLHKERPKDYKDDNHKPEMAIAITDFEALCSFVPMSELSEVLRETPELQSCMGDKCAAGLQQANGNSKQALREAFTAIMTCPAKQVAAAIQQLCTRLQQEKGRQLTDKEQLVLRLNKQYPDDVGILAVYFLNYIRLKADQAIYLPANEPHAYVSGELVECMATSDNVIRAGLTPKLRDTEVLCSSLTYSQGPPEVLQGDPPGAATRVYRPPFDEFEVLRVEVPAGESDIVTAKHGPTVVLAIQGAGQASAATMTQYPHAESSLELHKGDVFFVPFDTPLQITASAAGPLRLWIAGVNQRVFGEQGPQAAPNEVTYAKEAQLLPSLA